MINSVLKAIDILQLFSPDHPTLALTEISNRLGYPKTTVHTILNTLESRNLIEKTDKSSYALGTEIIRLTQAVRINVNLRDRAAPLLRELGDFCEESVYLTILDGNYCLYIYAIESSDRLLARSAVGQRSYLHCTSVGKAILAFLPRESVECIVEEVGLPSFTEQTITDKQVLYEELANTKKHGFALDFAEHEERTFCIGSPIFNEQGRVIGSCSIAGANPEIVRGRVEDFSPAVRYTAQEISRRMGFVPKLENMLWRETSNPLRKE